MVLIFDWLNGIIIFLVISAVILITISYTSISRRLRDIGLPGTLALPYILIIILCLFYNWYILLGFALYVCLIPWIFIPGTKGPNKYGPPPNGWDTILNLCTLLFYYRYLLPLLPHLCRYLYRKYWETPLL